MPLNLRAQPSALWAAALALFALAGGCERSAEWPGLTLQPPAGWQPTTAEGQPVPGVPLAAWTGPQGARLVVYRTLPNPGGTPASAAKELATRLANLPELKVLSQRVESYGGYEAGRVEAVAPGSGSALAPSGTGTPVSLDDQKLVPTRLVSVAFVRPGGTLWATWYYPDAAHDVLGPQVEATLRSLQPQVHGTLRWSLKLEKGS